MDIGQEIIALAKSDAATKAGLLLLGATIGWLGNFVASWWKMRDRYRAHVTWRTINTQRGPEQYPVLVIQSVHSLPINIIGVRVRNGFRLQTRFWAFDGEDPDYPVLPRTVEPMKETMFVLDEDALKNAAAQSRLAEWLWVPRVYVGVQTLGRGERVFAAEGGLPYSERRKRYQR